MSDIKFSIIIPAYNNTDTIEQCLNSIYNQTYKNFEVILVDDCSPDVDYSYLKVFYNDLNVMRLSENGGPASARQAGMDKATGDWVFFVDQDDELLNSTVLEHIHDLCNLYSNDSVIECHFIKITKTENGELYSIPHTGDMRYIHGLIFKLEFIRDHDIRFLNTVRCHEDVHFYLLCKYITKYTSGITQGRLVPVPAIVYKYNNFEKSITQESYGPYDFFEYSIYDQFEMWTSLYNRLESIIDENDKQDILFALLLNFLYVYERAESYFNKTNDDTRLTRISMFCVNVFNFIVPVFNIKNFDEIEKLFTTVYNRDSFGIAKVHEVYGFNIAYLIYALRKLYMFYIERNSA